MKFEERKFKEAYYTNYVKAISNNVLMKDEHAELDDAQNRLILVGSAEVVCFLMQFHDAIKLSAPPLSGEEHDKILTDLIKAMRADLYGTKKINDGYPLVHLSGLRLWKETISYLGEKRLDWTINIHFAVFSKSYNSTPTIEKPSILYRRFYFILYLCGVSGAKSYEDTRIRKIFIGFSAVKRLVYH